MSSNTSVDVLVIGLGPAGASAAAAAARDGASVLAIDRKQVVGLPVQCAEFLPRPMGKFAQASGVLMQTVQGMCTELPSGAKQRDALPGLMIDRAAFDQALAREAQRCGAQLALANFLLGLDVQRSRAYVKQGTRTIEIQYRVLIAADGPHSRVAALLGLAPLETLVTRQYTVALERAHHDTDIWLSSTYPGGYAWLFPKGSRANIGVGMEQGFSSRLKFALDTLHARLQAEGRVGDEILARTGGLIPVGGLRDPLRLAQVLFVGDAAGLTHPITGAGISAALVSGDYAGAAAAEFCASGQMTVLSAFEAAIRDHYAAHLDYARVRRKQLVRRGADDSDEPFRAAWIAFDQYHAPRRTHHPVGDTHFGDLRC